MLAKSLNWFILFLSGRLQAKKRTLKGFTNSPLLVYDNFAVLNTAEPQNLQEEHSKTIPEKVLFKRLLAYSFSTNFIYGGEYRGRFALHCFLSVAVSEPVISHRPNLRNLSGGLFQFLLGASA